jgi:hypothetical protein
MTAPAEGGDIIIRGGSAEIEFNHDHFPKTGGDPNKRKHDGRRITRIVVSGTEHDFIQNFPGEGFKGEITVTYKKI